MVHTESSNVTVVSKRVNLSGKDFFYYYSVLFTLETTLSDKEIILIYLSLGIYIFSANRNVVLM